MLCRKETLSACLSSRSCCVRFKICCVRFKISRIRANSLRVFLNCIRILSNRPLKSLSWCATRFISRRCTGVRCPSSGCSIPGNKGLSTESTVLIRFSGFFVSVWNEMGALRFLAFCYKRSKKQQRMKWLILSFYLSFDSLTLLCFDINSNWMPESNLGRLHNKSCINASIFWIPDISVNLISVNLYSGEFPSTASCNSLLRGLFMRRKKNNHH